MKLNFHFYFVNNSMNISLSLSQSQNVFRCTHVWFKLDTGHRLYVYMKYKKKKKNHYYI